MILYLNLEIKTLIINDVLCLQKMIEGYINDSCLENIKIFFIETQQRLWWKMVELMEGFFWVEKKTKISATHR